MQLVDPQYKVEIWNKGLELIREGKVAVIIVAGGRGTRLQYD